MINAASRVAEAKPALDLMLAKDDATALALAARVNELNLQRREIEAGMRQKAMTRAIEQIEYGYAGLVIAMEDGHAGISGIVAGRIASATNRPTVCLAPKLTEPQILTGSIRSVPGINVHQVLAWIDQSQPGLLERWGGHEAAAGCAIHRDRLGAFMAAFDAGVRRQAPEPIAPTVWTDGALAAPTLSHLAEMEALAPYGREFELPTFSMQVLIEQIKPVGDGRHLKLTVRNTTTGQSYPGIWFSAIAPGEPLPLAEDDSASLVYSPQANVFRGRTTLQLQVVHAVRTQ